MSPAVYSLFVDRVDELAAERRRKVVKNALEVTHEEPHVSVSKIKTLRVCAPQTACVWIRV